MTTPTLKTVLSAALLFSAALPMAAQDKPAPKAAAGQAAKGKAPMPSTPAKGKLKPVDINSATKNELGFMLGIPAELAAKIVAGRPYRTKAHLVTHNIVSADVYARIKDKVIAKQ